LETKIQASKLAWIKKITDINISTPWKMYLVGYFRYPPCEFPLYNLQYEDCPKVPDLFYQEMFKTWCNLHVTNPLKAENIVREVIWGNQYNKVNNSIIRYEKWKDAGMYFIQDLLDNQGNIEKKIA
jgi:hypothetical protein